MPPGVPHGSNEEERNCDDAFEDDNYTSCNTPDKTELKDLRTLNNVADDTRDQITKEKNKAISETRTKDEKSYCEADVDENDFNEREEADSLLDSRAAESPTDRDFKHEDTKADVVEESSVAPDGGWGWFIILGALCLRIIIGGLGRSHGLFYIKFKERFVGSATATALVTSLTGLLRLGGGPFVSVLCSRFHCRYLTFLGALLLATGLILTGFSPSLQFLYFSYGIICGLGRAFALTPVPILLGYYFDKRRSLAFGLASAGFSIGGFGITPMVEILFQTFGFQGTFLLLSGITLNIVVCSALFRPIELQRKISRKSSKHGAKVDNQERLIIRSIEDIQSGQILSTSTISIERIRTISIKSNETSHSEGNEGETKSVMLEFIAASKENQYCCDKNGGDEIDKNSTSVPKHSNTEDKIEDKTQKRQLIAWSILKDIRFLCFCLSNFLITLPSGGLFLPSLAKDRGTSDLKAAALLSFNAGSDTVFRVISGFVLDLKIFRQIRPQIYSTVVLLQGVLYILYPLMNSYAGFVTLCICDGAVGGVRAAQNSVVVMDILGVDKLASSMVVTMSVQALAVIIGPTVSGRLRDITGVYDGTFYFGGSAVILGGLVMTGGNLRKYLLDRRQKRKQEQDDQSAGSVA